MRIVERVDDVRAAVAEARASGQRIAFVPTMGALHDGHAALMREAKEHGSFVVVSVFVNPRQFGAGEDLDRYPHTPGADEEVVEAAGGALLWRPSVDDVYGTDDGLGTTLGAGPLGTVLEGRDRPGHFDGVVAVVARLLGGVQPDLLYLGEKDYQQLVVLRRLVTDLQLPAEVRGVTTKREADGVARSSRNAYLSDDERRAARALPNALAAAQAAAATSGSVDAIRDAARARLVSEPAPGIEVAYVELVDPGTLEPLAGGTLKAPARLLLAARVGTTRLIDNALIEPKEPT